MFPPLRTMSPNHRLSRILPHNHGVRTMNDEIEAAMISRRRAFWILAAGAALPAALVTASDVEAQTPGMERRQDRRENRRDRREDRREGRQDRRDERRGTVGQGNQNR